MSYLDSLSTVQKQNATILTDRMKAAGITNPYTQAAILAVISKESAFIPKSENLSYSAQRIMQVWPKIPANVAAQLQNNPEALGNYIYGPEMNKTLGNSNTEGYKYRGRGYNQITGKANYANMAKQLGVDLVNNPDLMNDPTVAANAAILFFKNGIEALSRLGKLSQYNATNINDFKTNQDSLGAIYHVNAGIGSSQQKLAADTTGGKAAASSRIGDLFSFLNTGVKAVVHTAAEETKQATEVVKKNPKTTIIIAAGIILAAFFLFKTLKPE